MSAPLAIVLLLVMAAEFTNGFTDAPNAIATAVSTRAISPGKAVIMAGVLNSVGALVTGTAVAATIGTDIIKPEAIGLPTVGAATLAVVVWSLSAWRYGGIPTSETHELIAGLAGAGLAVAGPSVLLWSGWRKVLIGLGISTIFGFVFGFVMMVIIYNMFRHASPSVMRKTFSRLEVVSAGLMAFSHGSNDGQKFMGAFTLALVLGGILPNFQVPYWVILVCGLIMAIGTSLGGWSIIKTMGTRITRLDSVQGFTAQTSASISIIFASFLGIPLSTTHIISSAIMGVGASQRISAVRWGTAREILMTWIVTFPACFIMGFIFASLAKIIF